MTDKMAVIGDIDGILAFKSVGVDAFRVSAEEEGRKTLSEIADKYAVIFITDTLANPLENEIKRYLTVPYPAILVIPSGKGDGGYSVKKLKEAMDKALGVDILFGDNEEKN